MTEIKYARMQQCSLKYSFKGISTFLLFLWAYSLCVEPVFGIDRTTAIELPIDERKEDIKSIRAQAALTTPVSHQLHAYVGESIGIVERLLTYVENDLGNGDMIAARVGMSEAGFLTSFLQEELAIAGQRDTARYEVIDVTQHGLKGDGIRENDEALNGLLASLKNNDGHVKLVFPEGDYYIKGKPGEYGLLLDGLENVTFQGIGNTTLLFDGLVTESKMVLIENCINLEFSNLSIDMRPIVCTLGEIVSVEGGKHIVIQVQEDYPLPDPSYWTATVRRGLVRDAETGLIMRDLGDPRVIDLEDLGDRKYRLTLDDNNLSGNPNMTSGFAEGQLFSLHPRARKGSSSTITIGNCRHLLFSHFNVNAGDGHLLFISGSAGIKFLDCDIMPREGRVIMNNADGFHCQSNSKGIYLERCRVLGMNDDCMNFYSKLSSIGEVKSDKEFILLISEYAKAKFKVGDNIAFLNSNTGEFDGITTIEAIEEVNWGDQTHRIQIQTTEAVSGVISRRSAGRPDEMTSREYTGSGGDNYRRAMAIDAPFEHMVLNLNLKNDGFIIRNCEFGFNRATGFKCKATNGVMRNTLFHDQVVLFKTGMDWLEGTFPSKIEMTDVTVNKGIRYHGTLPGKLLPSSEAVKYMKYVNFENVIDGNGDEIPEPDEVN